MPGFPARTNPFASAPPTQRRWISRRDWQDIRRATQRLQVDGVYAVTVHGVKVEFDKNHPKQAKAAAPRAAAEAGGDAEAGKPRRRRAMQLKRDALRQRHHQEAQQQQQRQVPPQQQQQEQQQQQGELPPPLTQQQQQQELPQLMPPSDPMDDERASKRGAVSPAQGSTPVAPRAKRTLTLAPPPPSLPPSPPSTPPRQAQRGGASGDAIRNGSPRVAPKPQSGCTRAPAPRAQVSARAAREALLHAASEASESDASEASDMRCTVCLRDFPWLYNEIDARCRTCDALDKHVRRIVSNENKGTTPPLLPGERVRLHSLSCADLNGKIGTLLVFVDDKERWAVKVDGKRVLVKWDNLEYAPSLRQGPPSMREFAWDYPEDQDSDDACQFRKPWQFGESDSD